MTRSDDKPMPDRRQVRSPDRWLDDSAAGAAGAAASSDDLDPGTARASRRLHDLSRAATDADGSFTAIEPLCDQIGSIVFIRVDDSRWLIDDLVNPPGQPVRAHHRPALPRGDADPLTRLLAGWSDQVEGDGPAAATEHDPGR